MENVLLEVFSRIKQDIQDKAFEHYLFVFGTVVVVKKADTVKQLEYSNFAPVYKGGPTHRHAFLVTKKYISNVDFLNRTTLPNPRNFDVTEYKHHDFSDKFNALLKERKVKLVQDNYIHVDGLTIGLEICLDHRKGALWENLQKYHGSELVVVLVVTSAGMSLE